MPLAPGARLGPYEILSRIGSGGMGEVWKAHDSRLNRDVAIKTSAAKFSERFEREARAIAALNHPHICQIYDVGPDYIVMELVDGSPVKGPLPLDLALRLAVQLAGAMEAAHRATITHRDLKPANVLVAKSGIKVLDFGLAKFEERKSVGPDDSTLTQALTQDGAIVGTLQYMAPEQLNGKLVDSRADIFSFGCVLYEMLTGKRAFDGATTASVIAGILEREPAPVGDVAPAALDRLMKRCLMKDADERYQSAHDVKVDLEWIASGGGAGAPAPLVKARAAWLAWAVAGVAILAAAGLAFVHFRATPPVERLSQFVLDAPADNQYSDVYGATAISPDGRYLVFGAGAASATPVLWLRPIGSLDARPIPGTEGGDFPFWSPDSKSLGFFAGGKLKRIDIAEGSPLVLCDAATHGTAFGATVGSVGGTWNEDGVILFAAADGLYRVAASGGAPSRVTRVDATHLELRNSAPQFLPDGKRFLYFVDSADPKTQGIYTGSLDKPEEKTRVLVTGSNKAIYIAPRNGHPGALLWLRGQTLMAQTFDAASLRLSGDPAPIAEDVLTSRVGVARAAFWASDAGLLVYRAGDALVKSRLVWIGRDGKHLEEAAPEDLYGSLSLSPDGKRVAINRTDSVQNTDVWVDELSRKAMTRLTFDPAQDGVPVWSPDGRQIAFFSARSGVRQIYRKDAGGGGQVEQLTSGPDDKIPTDWSRDGKYIVYMQNSPKTRLDVWALPLEADGSGTRKPIPLVQTPFDEGYGRLSPDGKWLAYQSDEPGANQVYVQAFPVANGKWQVSTNGGTGPAWRGDGKEIFYELDSGNQSELMAAGIGIGPNGVDVETPRELFSAAFGGIGGASRWAVTPDGQRFLVEETTGTPDASPLVVVQNWRAGMKK